MDHKKITLLKALANNLKRTIPVTHKDLYHVHKAPERFNEAEQTAIEMGKLEAVMDYIKSQPESQQDTAGLESLKRKVKVKQARLDETEALAKQLTNIAIDHQIEQAAEAAGAKSPGLIAMVLREAGSISHTVNPDGTVDVMASGQPLTNAIKTLSGRSDIAPLFDTTKPTSTKTPSGKNPWMKGPAFNVTEQGRIYRQDPTLAKSMMEQARQA